MNRLGNLSLQGNLHLVAITVLVVILATINIYYSIFALFLVRIKPKFIIMGIALFLLSIRTIDEPVMCTIIEIDEYNTCSAITNIRIKGDYSVGDIVELNGTFSIPSGKSSPFSFNYRNYLLGKNIHFSFYDQNSKVIGHRFTIYQVRDWMKVYINRFDEMPRKYLSALILGDKQYFDQQELSQFSEMGISHMFAISGLHVGFLALMLERFMKKKYVIVIILVYMIVAGFTPSIVRAGSMYIMYHFIKDYGFTSLDCLSAVFLGSIVLNRFIVYDVGFQLSFLVTFFLLTTNPKNLLDVSIIAQYATLPMIINMYNQINLITIFINVYLVWIMSNIILPFGFATLVLKIDDIYSELLFLFERIVYVSSDFNMIISIPNIHPALIGLYYFFIKRRIVVLFLLIPMFVEPSKGVYFIDVGQGDSTLIVDEYVYLIDTGGKQGLDVTSRSVVPLIRSLGINEIDYFVLTHNHYDHIAGYDVILDAFNVNTIVTSKYAQFYIDFDGRKLEVTAGDTFGAMKVLGPDEYEKNINNQSIQLKLQLGKTFYLMGDSELKESYGHMDYLKLGHHGSLTSTTEEMLRITDPEAVIISLGRNNYGLPSEEVLKMIEEYKVYRTDFDGTIIYRNNQMYTTRDYDKYFLGFR